MSCSNCRGPCPLPYACQQPLADLHDSMAKPNGTGLPIALMAASACFAAIAAVVIAFSTTNF